MTDETKRIVEWLREQWTNKYAAHARCEREQMEAGFTPRMLGFHPSAYATIAHQLERGDHLKDKTE